MDLEFIRRAERVTSFNITTKDLETLKHKVELQHLFNKHFFPNFDISRTIDSVDMAKLNALIADLKREDGGTTFPKLHSYNLKGVGPGEATLFFLINGAHLGGGSSAGVDLFVGSNKYEVKAVKVSSDRYATDFKLGGNVPLADLMQEFDKLRVALKLPGNRTEMSGSVVKQMQEKAPFEYRSIVDRYAEVAYENYFKAHEVIFINNAAGPKLGFIEAVKQVKKSDIHVERVTSGTIKPKVKL